MTKRVVKEELKDDPTCWRMAWGKKETGWFSQDPIFPIKFPLFPSCFDFLSSFFLSFLLSLDIYVYILVFPSCFKVWLFPSLSLSSDFWSFVSCFVSFVSFVPSYMITILSFFGNNRLFFRRASAENVRFWLGDFLSFFLSFIIFWLLLGLGIFFLFLLFTTISTLFLFLLSSGPIKFRKWERKWEGEKEKRRKIRLRALARNQTPKVERNY